MKVLHLISGGDEGGAKTHVLTLLNELNHAMDITLVCLMKRSFSDAAEALGINTLIIEQKQRYNLKVIKTIIKILDKGYDLLHCHGARANFVGMLIKKRYNIPIVTTLHSDYKLDFENSLYKKLIYTGINAFSLKHMDYYIAITHEFKRMMLDRGFDENKFFVAYNGLDLLPKEKPYDIEAFLSSYQIPFDTRFTYIGIAARLHPVKGISVFLKAAKELLKFNKHLIFLIAGDGEKKYTEKCKAYVKKHHLENHIKFLGLVKNMSVFYQSIHINVLTSHSESFPYALLEGGGFALPTIASSVGGIPEMIEHNITGLLFRDGNYLELARYMKELVDSTKKREQLGQQFRRKIEDNFSSKNMAKTHMNIYQSILRGIKNESSQ